MKLPSGIKTWGVAGLGVVCALLVANLVAQYRDMQPGHSHAHPARAIRPTPRAVKGPAHAADDLVQYDPDVHFAALKELESCPLPDEDRNPFEFVGGGPAPIAQPPTPAAKAEPPPPPPPPPLKAVGYNELPGGKKEAMVTFNDDLVVVHEGETVGSKFKVVKINPSMVVVEDGDTHQNIELPFPQ